MDEDYDFDFHSSDYNSDADNDNSNNNNKSSANKPKRGRPKKDQATSTKGAAKKSKVEPEPAVDYSLFREPATGNREFSNRERSTIFLAMAAARARLGVDIDNNGKKVFLEVCKVLDEYHDKYPLSKTITPRTLVSLWGHFKRTGSCYAKNVDKRWMCTDKGMRWQ